MRTKLPAVLILGALWLGAPVPGAFRAAHGKPAAAKTTTRTAKLAVEGMSCGSCAATITAALKEIDGVKDAKVSAPRKQAIVQYDPTKVTPEKLVEAVNETGFTATLAGQKKS